MKNGTTGTYTLDQLLQIREGVEQFGTERLNEALEADRAAHNEVVEEMVTELAEPTTERMERYGTSARMHMYEVDETGETPTQRVTVGGEVAYPLRKFELSIGWTKDYLEVATVRDLAQQQEAAEIGHLEAIQAAYRRAIFSSANFTIRDLHTDRHTLNIKRFVNADGSEIPNGPNGQSFDPDTHTHYHAINWAASTVDQREAALRALIQDVVEHGHGQDVRLYINLGNAEDLRALPGFKPLMDARVIVAQNVERAVGELDVTRLDDREIGIFDSARVYTKPWIPLNYPFVFSRGSAGKPVAFRQSVIAARRGLRLRSLLPGHPHIAEFMDAFFGVGVKTRTNGAVLYMGGGVFVNPLL